MAPRLSTRERNRRKFLKDPKDPRHGTTNGYSNLRCRGKVCKGACTEAWRRYHLDYMHDHPEQYVRHAAYEAGRRKAAKAA